MIYLKEMDELRYIQKCIVAGNIWRNLNWMSVPLEVVTLSFKTERITSLVERPFPGQNRLQHSLQLKDSWRKTSVNDFMSKDCKLFSQMSQKLPQHTWWDSSLWNITLLKDAEEEPSIKISSAYVPSGTLRYLWAGGPCIANQLHSLCPSLYPFELSDDHFLDGPMSYLIWSKHCFSLKWNQIEQQSLPCFLLSNMRNDFQPEMVHTLVAVRSKKVPTILHIPSIPTNFHNSPLFPPCTAPSPSFMNTLGTLGSRPRHPVGYFLGRRQNWVKPIRFGFVSDCNVAVQCQLSMFVHCICSSPVLSTCSRKVERACREYSCREW